MVSSNINDLTHTGLIAALIVIYMVGKNITMATDSGNAPGETFD